MNYENETVMEQTGHSMGTLFEDHQGRESNGHVFFKKITTMCDVPSELQNINVNVD